MHKHRIVPILILCGVLVCITDCGKKPVVPVANDYKIVLIGFDAATWNIMDTLLAEGKLPHFAQLISNGVRAPLATLSPTVSPSIWTTILTGVLPQKHGITGFADDEGKLLTSQDRKVKSLWEICSDYTVPAVFINFWNTWPAEQHPHVQLVSDRFIFPEVPYTCYPEDLLKETSVQAVYPLGYMDGFLSVPFEEPGYPSMNRGLSTYVHLLRESIALDEMCRKAGMHIYKSFDKGLFAIYFRYLDIVQHAFWQFMESSPEDTRPELDIYLKNVIPYYYQYYDRILGEFMDTAKPETDFVIVSDHGASSATKEREYALNKRLSIKPVLAVDTRTAKRFRPDINRILHWLGFLQYKDNGAVDYSQTLVFDMDSFNLTWDERQLVINLRGKFPEGRVKEERVDGLRTRVIKELSGLKTLSSGEKVFNRVKPSQSGIYCMFNDEVSPENTIQVRSAVYSFQEGGTFTDVSGAHVLAPDGIFIISGKNIMRDQLLGSVSVQDIAPTILYMLGLPLSRNLDGTLLEHVFLPGYLEQFPPRYVTDYGKRESTGSFEDLPHVDKKLRNQLKSLGYLN